MLRDDLGLYGTKMGCNRMSCGACTVLIDSQAHEARHYMALPPLIQLWVPTMKYSDPVAPEVSETTTR